MIQIETEDAVKAWLAAHAPREPASFHRLDLTGFDQAFANVPVTGCVFQGCDSGPRLARNIVRDTGQGHPLADELLDLKSKILNSKTAGQRAICVPRYNEAETELTAQGWTKKDITAYSTARKKLSGG